MGPAAPQTETGRGAAEAAAPESERGAAASPAPEHNGRATGTQRTAVLTAVTETVHTRRTPTSVQPLWTDAPPRPGRTPPLQDGPPPADYARVRPRRRRLRALLRGALGLALMGAVVVAGASALRNVGGGAVRATGPLSAGEVSDVANAFAAAYGDEDPKALRATLARDVTRALPTGVTHGREAVVREYERQFAAQATRDYEIADLQVASGRVARATGTYTVTRAARPPIHGKLTLGVVRENGRAKIALIAATPD